MMEILLFLLAMVGLSSWLTQPKALPGVLNQMARERPWTLDRTTGVLTGVVDGVDVEVRQTPTGLQLQARCSPTAPVDVRAAGVLARTDDVQVGDEAFDARFVLAGPSDVVLAVLDSETRRELSGWDGRVEKGAVVLRTALHADHPLRPEIARAVRIALAMRLPDDVPSRLAERVVCQGERLHVRCRALEAMIVHHGSYAREWVGELLVEATPDELLAPAVQLGGGDLVRQALPWLLRRVGGSVLLWRAVYERCTSLGVALPSGHVQASLTHPELVGTVARYLIRLPDEAHLPHMVESMARADDLSLMALIDAVVALDDVTLVPVLLPHRFSAVPWVRDAAERGIATLQQGVDPQNRGGLSLAGGQGRLTAAHGSSEPPRS